MASESRSRWWGTCHSKQGTRFIRRCRSNPSRVSVRLRNSLFRVTRLDGIFQRNTGSALIWEGGVRAEISWLSRWLLVLKFQARTVWVPESHSREAWVDNLRFEGTFLHGSQIYCIELLSDLCKCWVIEWARGYIISYCCRTMFFQQWSECNWIPSTNPILIGLSRC